MRKKLIPTIFTIMLVFLTLFTNSVLSVIPVYATPSIEDIEESIRQYDDKIQNSMVKINDLNVKIAEKEKEIAQTEESIKVTQADYEIKKEMYSNRIRGIYITGGFHNQIVTYIDAVISGRNLTDIVNKIDSIQKIMKYDKNLIDEVSSKKKELEQKREQVINDRQSMQESKEAVQKEAQEIETSKQNLMKQLEELRPLMAMKLMAQNPVPISAEASEKAKVILTEAQKYLGIPYVWGGTTVSGFDCSGFTQYVFGMYGIDLPRVASSQQQVGLSVPTNQLQPGDLVFFGSPAYHVGIYIGDGQFIHAPQTGDVIKISNLNFGKVSSAKRVIR